MLHPPGGKHHRKSTRLRGYDYSQMGLYFITICTHNRECLFGSVVDGTMILNGAGKAAHQFWIEIPEHFPNAVLHEHIVMPNHVHGIIEISGAGDCVGAKNFSPLHLRSYQKPEFKSPSKTIGSVVRGYKIAVTKWFRNSLPEYDIDHKIWQRNYHDHIIRDGAGYDKISYYIVNNAANWQKDKFYPENT